MHACRKDIKLHNPIEDVYFCFIDEWMGGLVVVQIKPPA